MKRQEGNKEGEMYVENIDELMKLIVHRMFRPWMYIDFLYFLFPNGCKLIRCMKNIQSISRKIIKETKEAYLSKHERLQESTSDDYSKKSRKTFSEILLDAHFSEGNFSSKDIEDEVHTFIMGGYDTVSTALNFILYLVGLDKNVQENITQELDSIFETDRKRMVTLDDLNQMKYIECVIKETLRLYPPVPFLSRKLQEDVQVGDYLIPKECNLVFILPMLHRDQEAFPNPEKFEPERFFDKKNFNRHPFDFIPFSAGSRNCIGQKFAMMEIKVLLAYIFRNYTIESLVPRDKIKIIYEAVLKNVDPIHLRITTRQD